MNHKKINIVFSVILCDAGDATRAMEISDGIRQYAPKGYEVDITFLSNGSRFEEDLISKGYKIYKCTPQLPGIGFFTDFKATPLNIVGDKELAYKLIEGEIKALKDIKPDIIIYGFNPIAGIARQMVEREIPGIMFVPLPLCKEAILGGLLKDIPDMLRPAAYLPKFIRRSVFKLVPPPCKLKNPMFPQPILCEAARRVKSNNGINNLFDMVKSDLIIVNDLKEFYKEFYNNDNGNMPVRVKITGPLYAQSSNNKITDKNIINIFNTDKLKIFCTLGSSGNKYCLFEAIKALTTGIGQEWNAVILVPPAVCSINEARECAGNSRNVYITDEFVPALIVNKMADIIISHGGQGTVQTAIASNTPIIGFGVQMEQQINLTHVEDYGAGIRIQIHKWKAANIQKAVRKIKNNPSYKINMNKLNKLAESSDSKKEAAEAIWDFIKKKC